MNSKEIVILDQGWACDLFALIDPYIQNKIKTIINTNVSSDDFFQS